MKKILPSLSIFMLMALPATALAATRSASFNSVAIVPTVLELTLSQAGQSELKFGNIQPSALGPTTSGPIGVQIIVTSNTGSRYQIAQSINGPLTNADGDEIPVDNISFTTDSEGDIGTPVSSPTPVSTGAQTIYTSTNQGSSDTVRADYLLTVPTSQEPGDYSSQIVYTVSSV